MALTNSWAFSKGKNGDRHMFDITRNRVGLYEDDRSIASRSRLLILTELGELYNAPNQGVGLIRHLFKYNTENEKALIRDRITEQLRLHEPYCIPDDTAYVDGLMFTGSDNDNVLSDAQQLKITVGIKSTYGTQQIEVMFNE